MTGTESESRYDIARDDGHVFRVQYCDINDVGPGCGWFQMPEGTLYEGPDMSRDDRRIHYGRAGEGQATT